jgi:hypothetical protein
LVNYDYGTTLLFRKKSQFKFQGNVEVKFLKALSFDGFDFKKGSTHGFQFRQGLGWFEDLGLVVFPDKESRPIEYKSMEMTLVIDAPIFSQIKQNGRATYPASTGIQTRNGDTIEFEIDCTIKFSETVKYEVAGTPGVILSDPSIKVNFLRGDVILLKENAGLVNLTPAVLKYNNPSSIHVKMPREVVSRTQSIGSIKGLTANTMVSLAKGTLVRFGGGWERLSYQTHARLVGRLNSIHRFLSHTGVIFLKPAMIKYLSPTITANGGLLVAVERGEVISIATGQIIQFSADDAIFYMEQTEIQLQRGIMVATEDYDQYAPEEFRLRFLDDVSMRLEHRNLMLKAIPHTVQENYVIEYPVGARLRFNGPTRIINGFGLRVSIAKDQLVILAINSVITFLEKSNFT